MGVRVAVCIGVIDGLTATIGSDCSGARVGCEQLASKRMRTGTTLGMFPRSLDAGRELCEIVIRDFIMDGLYKQHLASVNRVLFWFSQVKFGFPPTSVYDVPHRCMMWCITLHILHPLKIAGSIVQVGGDRKMV